MPLLNVIYNYKNIYSYKERSISLEKRHHQKNINKANNTRDSTAMFGLVTPNYLNKIKSLNYYPKYIVTVFYLNKKIFLIYLNWQASVYPVPTERCEISRFDLFFLISDYPVSYIYDGFYLANI